MTAEEYLRNHWVAKQVWRRLEVPLHQERLRRCAEAVAGGSTFIDVGCALGHSTAILKKFCPGNLTGFDNDVVIEEARRLFPGIEFIHSILDGAQWDGVVCSEVIEHVEDDADWVRTLWRITGKKLVVTTPAIPVKDPGHMRLYTEESLRALFAFIPGAAITRRGRFWFVTAQKGE